MLHWLHCDTAQDVAEYAVLIAVVMLIVAITASALGTNVHTVFARVAQALSPTGR
jgi:Flp pilus assembly pilin Flp